MYNGVSGLHEQGTLVIPWVVVLLLTFGSTGGTAVPCHVSYVDDLNALHWMTSSQNNSQFRLVAFFVFLVIFSFLKEQESVRD
jgi:hypothetical protein